MTTHKFTYQFGSVQLAGVSRRGLLASLFGLLAAITAYGAQAQESARLQPADIVYVDSGDAVLGGLVIKVDGRTHEKYVISAGGLLQMPFGVVIDEDGRIIVSDSGRLIQIDSESGAQRLIADNSGGNLGWPCGLAKERHGSIVVANLQAVVRVNLNSRRIQTVSAGGSLLAPVCVAVTEQSEVIVLNLALPPEIIRVNPNGTQTIFARGGLLNRPQAIAVHGDHIFVTDVATADGNFGIGRVIDVDASTGEQSVAAEGEYLCGPVGLAVDDEGQLIVGDPYIINLDSPDRFDGGIIGINPVTHEQTLIIRGEGAMINPRGVAIVPSTSR